MIVRRIEPIEVYKPIEIILETFDEKVCMEYVLKSFLDSPLPTPNEISKFMHKLRILLKEV